jgi:hypothetical protein
MLLVKFSVKYLNACDDSLLLKGGKIFKGVFTSYSKVQELRGGSRVRNNIYVILRLAGELVVN